jgi:energy-coupling factor transport system permease protein
VPLVLVSLNKAENLALAMETRGYSGGRRTYLKKPGVTGSDYIFGAVLLLLLICVIAARVGGYGTM